ncbi:hypothetical protein [uncultured Phenylobacterium sp.]|uniref:hypothetical protein n=1 Tax=uncultured Phenylobacterium sp. TaxID=349273 RepID=UPI0025E4807B|nr:hypothetical protein [uncultured Phenylobacterium sp.]
MAMFGRNIFRDSARRSEEERLSRDFVGSVAGVHFDLRHGAIPAGKWACPRLITERPPGHRGFYVAANPASKNLFQASLTTDLDGIALRTARKHGLDILFVGDRVTVTSATVVDLADDEAFALAPDRHAAIVHLLVTREGGAQEDLQPLYIWPRGSQAASYDGDTLARLADRIDSLVRAPPEQSAELRSLAEEVSDLKREMELLLWDSRREATKNHLVGLADAMPAVNLGRLVNLAALYGYRQGWAEAAHEMRPLAQRSIERAKQSRDAGRAGRYPARVEFAEDYWARYPTATAYRVAVEFKKAKDDRLTTVQSIIRSTMPFCPPTSPSFKPTEGDHPGT